MGIQLLPGLLLLALLRRKGKGRTAKPPKSPLLRMKHPVQTVSLLPGRVRFRVPALRHHGHDARRVQDQLGKIQGVRSVEVNAVSGSVLVRYDFERIEAELLFAAIIRILGLEKELEKAPRGVAGRELNEISSAINRALYDQTHGLLDLSSTLTILTGAMALNRLLTGQLGPATLASLLVAMRTGNPVEENE